MIRSFNWMSPWIQTFTGRKAFGFALAPEAVDIKDIAHASGFICRYLGHTRDFYSVAQHSIYVSQLVGNETKDPKMALWGLLHDAHEVYTLDVPTPYKRGLEEFGFYKGAESIAMNVVADVFGLPYEKFDPGFQYFSPPKVVQKYDREVFLAEVRDQMQPLHPDWHPDTVRGVQECRLPKITGWGPALAVDVFMNRFLEIQRGCAVSQFLDWK